MRARSTVMSKRPSGLSIRTTTVAPSMAVVDTRDTSWTRGIARRSCAKPMLPAPRVGCRCARGEPSEYLARLRGRDEIGSGEGRDAPIHDPERQHEHGGGKPAAAKMTRLPDLLGAARRQTRNHGAAALSAAGIVSAVRADQVERARVESAARTIEWELEQLGLLAELAAADGPRRVARIHEHPTTPRALGGASRSADGLNAHALFSGPGLDRQRRVALEARRAQSLRPPREGLLDEKQAGGGKGGAEHRVTAGISADRAALRSRGPRERVTPERRCLLAGGGGSPSTGRSRRDREARPGRRRPDRR